MQAVIYILTDSYFGCVKSKLQDRRTPICISYIDLFAFKNLYRKSHHLRIYVHLDQLLLVNNMLLRAVYMVNKKG